MSRFQFSMQKILDIKVKNREQEEWNYAQILKRLNDEKVKMNELVLSKESLQKEMVNNQTEGVSIIELNGKQSYVQHLDQLIHSQRIYINEIREQVQKKQQELIELKIEEKKWVKLREKKYEEYVTKNNQIEQKELDEIANHLMFK